MNHILKKSLLILSLCGLGACTDIEQTIFDAQTPANSINKQADVDLAIVGLYAQLNSQTSFKNQIEIFIPFADDLSSTIGGTSAGAWGAKVTANSGLAPVLNAWNRFYQAIANANAVISYAETLNLSDTYRAQAIGEAKFIRGFCYFYLVQYFGGVPLVTKVSDANTDFKPRRNTVDEVYKLIIDDLTEGSKVLPLRTAQPASQLNRATKGAAQGYLAKAYLTYGNYLDLNGKSSEAQENYAKASVAADDIINSGQYQLLSDYGKLWEVESERSAYAEVIFGIAYARDPSITGISGEGSSFSFFYNPTTRVNISGNLPSKNGQGAVKVHPWFYEMYTKGDYINDYRVEKTFLTTWIGSDSRVRVTFPLIPPVGGVVESQPYINKYVDPNGLANTSNENDLFLLRFSEIYLIKAEVENELNGPTPVALAAFNKVRERARNANGVARTTPVNLTAAKVPTKEDLRLQIFDERGLEFVGEFNRWFDLVRMRYKGTRQTMYEYQFGTFLPTITAGLPTYTAATRTWSAGRTERTNIIPFDKKYLLYPLPANELGVNTNLSQNPGW